MADLFTTLTVAKIKEGVPKENIITVRYEGPIIGTNSLKSQHWSKAKKVIDGIKIITKTCVMRQVKRKIERYGLLVGYGSGHDVDNISGGNIKIFNDQLTKCKKIIDDDKKKFLWSFTYHNDHLKKDEIVYEIIVINE